MKSVAYGILEGFGACAVGGVKGVIFFPDLEALKHEI